MPCYHRVQKSIKTALLRTGSNMIKINHNNVISFYYVVSSFFLFGTDSYFANKHFRPPGCPHTPKERGLKVHN